MAKKILRWVMVSQESTHWLVQSDDGSSLHKIKTDIEMTPPVREAWTATGSSNQLVNANSAGGWLILMDATPKMQLVGVRLHKDNSFNFWMDKTWTQMP